MGVEIKSSKDGFRIVIDSEENVDSAKEKLIKKFDESINFFKGAKFLNIESSNLLEADIINLKNLLQDKYYINFEKQNKVDANIKYFQMQLSSFDKTINKLKKITGENKNKINTENEDNNLKTKFIFENMRSGAEVVYEGNIVVFGDVNPGAKLIANGNIIIMGICRGTVHAGENSEENRFISALKLKPIQMKVNGKFALPPEGADFIENAIVKIVNNEIKIEQF